METVILEGKEFVKASKAAKDLGYTSDHVGQLCRSGKVTARLVGRAWYVLKEDLYTHKTEKKRILRAKAREQAKKSIEEHRKKTHVAESLPKSNVIRYESDDRELIPVTRKMQVSTFEEDGRQFSEDLVEVNDFLVQEVEGEVSVPSMDDPIEVRNSEKLSFEPNNSRSVPIKRTVTRTPVKVTRPSSRRNKSESTSSVVPDERSSVLYYVSSTFMYVVISILLVCSTGTAWRINYINDGTAKSSQRITWSLNDVIDNMRI